MDTFHAVLLSVNDYVFSLILGIDSIYILDSRGLHDNRNLLSFGTTVLLRFDVLHSLEKYIRSVYRSAYPLTLYFQIQFINVHSTINGRSAINPIVPNVPFLYPFSGGRERVHWERKC